MTALGWEFATRLYDITTLIVEYRDAGGKRRDSLDTTIPRALAELDHFVSRPEVEKDIEDYLRFRREHARPDGTAVRLSDMSTPAGKALFQIEQKAGRFASMKRPALEKLLRRFFRFNHRQRAKVTGLTAEVLIKFLMQGLTGAYVSARDARGMGKRAKKAAMEEGIDLAELLGYGAALARYNPFLENNPNVTLEDIIRSIELGMAGVHEAAQRSSKTLQVAQAVKTAIALS